MRRFGLLELILIVCIALVACAATAVRWLRTGTALKTFNKKFFLSLTLILALFALAEFWLFYE